ncbi:MAG: hypothetical protein RLZZ403_794, partial [Pseudomonadota bacterium]
ILSKVIAPSRKLIEMVSGTRRRGEPSRKGVRRA